MCFFPNILTPESITFHTPFLTTFQWKLYQSNTVLWITYILFTIILQWVNRHSLVTTGLGIKSHHSLCSGPGIATDFMGNLSRQFYYTLFSPSVKWIQIVSAASQDCLDDWYFDDGEIWMDVTRHAQNVGAILRSNETFSLGLVFSRLPEKQI